MSKLGENTIQLICVFRLSRTVELSNYQMNIVYVPYQVLN